MDKDALAKRLMALFLTELEDHEQTLERDLLALEKEGDAHARAAHVESVFRAAHSLKGAARAVQAKALETICHRLEQTLSELRDQPGPVDAARMKVLFAEFDAIRAAGNRLRTEHPPQPASAPQPVKPAPVQTAVVKPAAPPAPVNASPVARVSMEKLDALLAVSGELMVASARVDVRLDQLGTLREHAARLGPMIRARSSMQQTTLHDEGVSFPALSLALAQLERQLHALDTGLRADIGAFTSATRRVDDDVRGLRMVPFREACEGLERSVRDLAQNLDKEVELHIEGAQVELDRELVQRLRDPLLHLVRNAVGHGLEARQLRSARGKSHVGRVRISSKLQGSLAEIIVEDDGAGLDLPSIRAKARALGLPEVSDDDELATYVFAPGLSTASSVTEIAGRGVGLDAVKRTIEALHGTTRVRSTAGRGTCFTLRVPITLSKLRCLFTRIGGRHYALPTSHTVRVLRFSPEQVLRIGERDLVRAESELVPLDSLSALLGVPEPKRNAGEQAQALVVTSAGRSVALITQELLGERETIVHKLPARVAAAPYVSGASVLSRGQVALILNGSELGRAALARVARSTGTLFSAPKPSKRRVLVVDDSITTRALVKSIVEEGGYDVTAARDGAEAFRLLQEQPFDLVVSDVQMPNMDGFALTEEIRRNSKLSRLPVILVTSLEAENDRLRGMEAGANAYLGKSAFDHRILLETIGGLL